MDRSPISSASLNCTPSPPFSFSWHNSLFPSWCCLISSSLTFSPWEPCVNHPSLSYCLPRACGTFRQPWCFAPGRPLVVLFFSPSFTPVLINVGMEMSSTIRGAHLSQQILFIVSWPSQGFTKLRLCPMTDVRDVRAKELPNLF